MLGITLAFLAQAAVPLQPSGKWILEGDNNMCALMHAFGEGRSQVTLGIRPWPLGGHADILFFRPDGHEGVVNGYEEVSFDSAPPAKAWYQSYTIQNKYERLAIATYPEETLQPAATAKQASVSFGGDPEFQMVLPDMKPALKALSNCNDMLLKSLGVDPAWREKTAVPAMPVESPGKWFTSKDYPDSAAMYGGQGRSRMLLTVGTDGRIAQCVNFGSSGNAKMDAAACKGFELRGRFHPAVDARGQPIIGYYMFTLDFQIVNQRN